MPQTRQSLENRWMEVNDLISLDIQMLEMNQTPEGSRSDSRKLIAWYNQAPQVRSVRENIFFDRVDNRSLHAEFL